MPGFTNDIFISFSHADNSEDWVTHFHDPLSNRLTQIGTHVKIWRDQKLRGIDVFSDEIFDQLQNSALLISIVSPSELDRVGVRTNGRLFERFSALNGGFRINISHQIRFYRIDSIFARRQDLGFCRL